jgi:hypothetical protein
MQKPKIKRWISSVKPVFLKKFEDKKLKWDMIA